MNFVNHNNISQFPKTLPKNIYNEKFTIKNWSHRTFNKAPGCRLRDFLKDS